MTHEMQDWRLAKVRVNCKDCIAECCKHIALQISTPRSWSDFQRIADYVQHKGVIVYKDNEGDWLIECKTRCKNLQGNRCRIWGQPEYPRTCAEYKVENCIMNATGDFFEVLFERPGEVAAYATRTGVKRAIRTIPRRECRTVCCNHIHIPLDDPDDWRDYDDMRWYLYHNNCTIYEDSDGWFLEFASPLKEECDRCNADACNDDMISAERVLRTPEDITALMKANGIAAPTSLALTSY